MVDIQQPTLTGVIAGTDLADNIIATTGGMVEVTLDAQAGNDTLTGTNVNANGVGILSSAIDAGLGNDTITGNATGANSIGMVDAKIYGGEGDDLIFARGTSAGIQGAILVGGAGNDTFDIQGGTGTIAGELGTDRIILQGARAEYELIPIDEVNTVIKVQGNGSQIITAQLEEFQFDDIVIPVDQLFAGGMAPPTGGMAPPPTEPPNPLDPVPPTGTDGFDPGPNVM